jgi:GT2 family glycosyltransferase
VRRAPLDDQKGDGDAMTQHQQRVCAVIVTHNRKELLRECIAAVQAQTERLARILVLDNASTDGTDAMLRDEFAGADADSIEIVRLPENIGGAGGFREGLKRAADGGYDWIWLMDDDTIAAPTALERLLAAHAQFPPETSHACSRAKWNGQTARCTQ